MRIGLFGGTFDPIHYGHLRPAVEMAENFSLQTLYLLPNHRPAHRGPTDASTSQRIRMLKLAINGAEKLAIDSREAQREKASYTIDSLSEIHNEHPQATLLFFMGMDAFAEFDTWHKWESILTLANLVVINRPGASHSGFSQDLVRRQQKMNGVRIMNGGTGVIEQFDVTQLHISATDIRRRVANNQTVRFLLPERVSEYIVQKQLYRKNN